MQGLRSSYLFACVKEARRTSVLIAGFDFVSASAGVVRRETGVLELAGGVVVVGWASIFIGGEDATVVCGAAVALAPMMNHRGLQGYT